MGPETIGADTVLSVGQGDGPAAIAEAGRPDILSPLCLVLLFELFFLRQDFAQRIEGRVRQFRHGGHLYGL